MFIQCQNCQTTFKIDENKIPQKDSAVRCSTCSELIPLSREEQDELLKKSPKKIIECNSCGTQYSVPLSSIQQETTKAKCGKCGNLFSISKSGDEPLSEESPSAKAYEDDLGTDDVDFNNIDIPKESEIEVDELFGDVSAKENKAGKRKGSGKNADEEYLESIKLIGDEDDQLEGDDDLGINEISEDHKYKIFLKPKGKKNKAKIDNSADSWLNIEDGPEESPGKKVKKKKPTKKAKKKTAKLGKGKRNIILWIIWGLIIALLAALAYVVMEMQADQFYSTPQTESYDAKSKIAILEPLNGKFVRNKNLKQSMFVLEGKLLNVYDENTALSNIEIEGYLYPKGAKDPITATSYAGVTLKEEQLKQLSKGDIEAELMSQAKRSDSTMEFASDDLIDFQVVFFNAPNSNTLAKLGAKIVKFNRRTK